MKPVLLFCICALVIIESVAQDGYGSTSIYDRMGKLPKGKHFFILPPNANWDQQKWADSVYLYEKFQRGKFEMATGFTPSHRPMMNYNILLESIDIRQPSGDIIVMKRSTEIKRVFIGEHEFIYHPSFGYLEIILKGKISVAQKTYMNAIYELSNGNRYPLRMIDIKGSPMKSTVYFWEEKQYYMLTGELKAYRSGSRVLPSAFPKNKKEIRRFVKINHIDYKDRDDILKVVAYANQLEEN